MKVKMPTIFCAWYWEGESGENRVAGSAIVGELALTTLPSTCVRIGSKLRCILPSPMSMASARTKCFECLASTGAYALGTMFPNPRIPLSSMSSSELNIL